MELVYRLFAEIDRIVYLLVSQILLLIDNLSKYNFFSADTIRNFTDKVYVIVGVLMLFKLVISAIQYIINPDSFSDKNKGLSSILTKSIISVGLIVLVPAIFEFAMNVQNDIVEAIPRVVFGSSGITGNSSEINEIGESIASTTLDSFLQPKEGRSPTKTVTSVGVGNFPEAALDGCNANFFSAEFWSGANCNYNYTFLISTIVGGFLVFILVSMAIDIGIRTIKLGIVQILAPIPIVSYISDEKKFNNWVQTSLQIYADLFIRMAIIYLVIYFMRVMLKDFFTTSGYPEDFATAIGRTPGIMEIAWVKIFIIIALLLFAKNAPKFITDLLGIKGVDDSITNMFKRAGGMFGAAGAGLTSGFANYQNRMRQAKADKDAWTKKSFGEKLRARMGATGSAVAGNVSALRRGTMSSLHGKSMKEAFNNGHKGAVTARQNRELDKMNGVTMGTRMSARYNQFMGLDTEASLAEGQQKAYSTLHKDVGGIKGAINGRIAKIPNVSIRTDVKENSALSQLGKLMEDNWSTIQSSNNSDLIHFANKFERTSYQERNVKTGQMETKYAWKLKDGETFSYHDIAAINADATAAGIGSIAGATRDSGPLMQLAQKEIQIDAMRNRVKLTEFDPNTGMLKSCDEINIGSGKTHTDITTAVGTAQQHIRENAVAIGKMEFVNKDTNQVEAVYSDDKLPNAILDRFSQFDDILQTRSAELSEKMSADKNAAALESIKRRDANKDKK